MSDDTWDLLTIGLSIIAIPIYPVVLGLVLRAACWMVGVKGPSFSKALYVNILVLLVAGAVAGVAMILIELSEKVWKPWMAFISVPKDWFVAVAILPIYFSVAAWIYRSQIREVSFGQGILLATAQFIIWMLIIAVLIVGFMVMNIAMRGWPLFQVQMPN